MIFQGLAVGGRIEVSRDPRVAGFLWRHDGEPLHLEVTPVLLRRTVPQNRRLWAGYARGLKSFSALTGHDRDELHDAMKRRSDVLVDVPLYTPSGDLIGPCRSTKHLARATFSDFNEEVSAAFAGWGLDLYPEPRL